MTTIKRTANELLEIDRLECERCAGMGSEVRKGFAYKGRTYPDQTVECLDCRGRGHHERPDVDAIMVEIRGRKIGTLRSARPKARGRAYFVWRMARFHGGVDVCMPMGAMMEVHGDPYLPLLEVIADVVARQIYGTDMAAAHRWGRALGHIDQDLPGLPATAYSHGPDRILGDDVPYDRAADWKFPASVNLPRNDSPGNERRINGLADMAALLAEHEGYPTFAALIDHCGDDSVVPGICWICRTTIEPVEPDQAQGWCDACKVESVIAATELAMHARA